MPNLDFSSQALPVSDGKLDFSANAVPVTKVGALENAGRQFVAGGGDVLNALDYANQHLNPAAMVQSGLAKLLGSPDANPLPALAKNAQDYGNLAPGEVPANFGADVSGKLARVIPSLAAAVGTGGESSLAGLLSDAVRSVPILGRVLGGVAAGAPTAATLTGIQATNLPSNMSTIDKVKATGKDLALNLGMAGLPIAAGESPLVRALTGGGIGYGASAGTSALSGQPQDQAQNVVGAILGSALGQHSAERPAPAMDPHLASYAAGDMGAPRAPSVPLQLPPGADYTGDFTVGNPRPVVPESSGPVAVTPAGEAFTPPQGLQTMADALAAAPKGKPALPPPTVAVDKAGTAMTTADQHTLATTEPPPQVASMLQALGLTPDVVRAQMAHPGMPRDNTQLNQALDMQSLLHPPALDNHPNAPGNNPTAPLPADNAPTAPKRAQLDTGRVDSWGRPIKVPALDYGRGDTLLHWLAANGGVDAAEMQRQTGLDPAATKDPAVMNPLGKVGMPALRRKGGMSTEQAFERMAQDGWFPGIDPNTPPAVGAQEAADMIHEALNGQKVFHPTEGQDQRIAAQFEEQMQQHQADQANMEGEARAEAAQALKARGIPPADHGQALTLAQLTSRAYDAGADPSQILDA
ncbi:MAG TPA: hypothetical protein VMV33_08980, partial [Rhodocyclaceae bacterium]|nr:hypothetical protein [Rhodocyclaceae bacterium]